MTTLTHPVPWDTKTISRRLCIGVLVALVALLAVIVVHVTIHLTTNAIHAYGPTRFLTHVGLLCSAIVGLYILGYAVEKVGPGLRSLLSGAGDPGDEDGR